MVSSGIVARIGCKMGASLCHFVGKEEGISSMRCRFLPATKLVLAAHFGSKVVNCFQFS